jgi:hypothetical protein
VQLHLPHVLKAAQIHSRQKGHCLDAWAPKSQNSRTKIQQQYRKSMGITGKQEEFDAEIDRD